MESPRDDPQGSTPDRRVFGDRVSRFDPISVVVRDWKGRHVDVVTRKPQYRASHSHPVIFYKGKWHVCLWNGWSWVIEVTV